MNQEQFCKYVSLKKYPLRSTRQRPPRVFPPKKSTQKSFFLRSRQSPPFPLPSPHPLLQPTAFWAAHDGWVVRGGAVDWATLKPTIGWGEGGDLCPKGKKEPLALKTQGGKRDTGCCCSTPLSFLCWPSVRSTVAILFLTDTSILRYSPRLEAKQSSLPLARFWQLIAVFPYLFVFSYTTGMFSSLS